MADHAECHRDIDQLLAEIGRLRAALKEASDLIEEWAAYASDYFQEKHDLAGDLARIDALIDGDGA